MSTVTRTKLEGGRCVFCHLCIVSVDGGAGRPPVAAVTAAVKVDAHSFTRTQRDTTALDTKTLGSWHLL